MTTEKHDTRTHARTHTHTHARAHARTHTHARTHARTRTRTHTHTHRQPYFGQHNYVNGCIQNLITLENSLVQTSKNYHVKYNSVLPKCATEQKGSRNYKTTDTDELY